LDDYKTNLEIYDNVENLKVDFEQKVSVEQRVSVEIKKD